MTSYIQTVAIYGGIFSTIAGVYELYESIREKNTTAVVSRIAIHLWVVALFMAIAGII